MVEFRTVEIELGFYGTPSFEISREVSEKIRKVSEYKGGQVGRSILRPGSSTVAPSERTAHRSLPVSRRKNESCTGRDRNQTLTRKPWR
jgi:hypothetical protein